MDYFPFSFSKFPLEEPFFCACLISNRCSSPELQPLVTFLQTVFPSQCVVDKISLQADHPHENMILHWNQMGSEWDSRISLKKLFERSSKYHVLSIGSMTSTPKIVLHNADLVIFDEEQDVNSYLVETRRCRVRGFEFDKHYMVVVNHIQHQGTNGEIQFLERKRLERYQQQPLLS